MGTKVELFKMVPLWCGPVLSNQQPATRLLSALVQWALLAAMAILIRTGPLMQWSGGRAIDVFGLVSIASPMPEMRWLNEALEEVHEFASHALIPLLAPHVLGALKRLIVDRDRVFQRMLRVRTGTREPDLRRERRGTN